MWIVPHSKDIAKIVRLDSRCWNNVFRLHVFHFNLAIWVGKNFPQKIQVMNISWESDVFIQCTSIRGSLVDSPCCCREDNARLRLRCQVVKQTQTHGVSVFGVTRYFFILGILGFSVAVVQLTQKTNEKRYLFRNIWKNSFQSRCVVASLPKVQDLTAQILWTGYP